MSGSATIDPAAELAMAELREVVAGVEELIAEGRPLGNPEATRLLTVLNEALGVMLNRLEAVKAEIADIRSDAA
jgi:hypothetical protein